MTRVRSVFFCVAALLVLYSTGDVSPTYAQISGAEPPKFARRVVANLLKKDGTAFVTDKQTAILVSYSAEDDVLTIYVNYDGRISGPARRIKQSDEWGEAYFKSKPDADLFIQSCGEPFGKDQHCDQYSELDKPVILGLDLLNRKTDSAKKASDTYHHLLQRIQEALKR